MTYRQVKDTRALDARKASCAAPISMGRGEIPVELTAWLCETFRLDPETDVIRHYDVTEKLCPLYYVEHPEAWDTFRADVAAAMEEDS